MARTQKKVWLALGIFAVAIGVRWPGLAVVMTADEANWMIRSSQFYNALLDGNPGGTFLTSHPGSTAMWIIGAGEKWQESVSGWTVDESTLSHFRLAAVLPLVVASALLIGIIAALLVALVGWPAAAAGGILLAAEPYIVGMTGIAHVDGIMSLLMLASLLAFMRRRLALAGIFMGLAMGCKLILAVWLWPVFAVILARYSWPRGANYIISRLGLVTGVAILTFWFSWPALWVKEDVGHSLTRDYAKAASDEHVALESIEDPTAPKSFYVRTAIGRVTPHTQLLALGAVIWLGLAVAPLSRSLSNANGRQTMVWLLIYSLGFVLFITMAAKKADRYALPALAAWPIIAGWACIAAGRVVERQFKFIKKARLLVYGVLLMAILAVPLIWTPWTLAYNNPFFLNVRPFSQQGWGEGLEEAAIWLNNRPNAAEMYIASWYPSIVQTFFVGKAMSLSSRTDYRVRYVVTYRNMRGRGPDDQATRVLEEVRNQKPVHTIFIRGVPYAWIYETYTVGTFTRHVGEIVGDKIVGQTVQPESNSWQWIDIGFATFSSRANTEDVILHVRRSLTATEDLRRVTVKAGEIVDNEWHRFEFEPITDAASQIFYVVVSSPTSVPGNAVTVRYLNADVRLGQMYVNGQPKEGDIAYRTTE